MNYYFSSCPPPPHSKEGEVVLKRNGYVLHSQFRERNQISKWIELKNSTEYNPHIFVDSGAYTAHTQGVNIDIDEYINYLNSIINDIELCASLDVIGNAEKSWENYLYMLSRISEPEKLLYTFHFGEDIKYLISAVDYLYKNNIPYMALGGMALIKDSNSRIDFINNCMKIIGNKIKVHLFGVTNCDTVKGTNIESVDSTYHIMTGAFGKIAVPTQNGTFKNVRPDEIKGTYLESIVNDLINNYCDDKITIDSLIESRNCRVYFNVCSILNNTSNFTFDSDCNLCNNTKESLW